MTVVLSSRCRSDMPLPCLTGRNERLALLAAQAKSI